MKKILLAMLGVGLASGAFGQGTVILENSLGTGNVTLDSANGPLAQPGTYQVALLWYNGTSFQQIGTVYQVGSNAQDGPGFFNGETVTVPTFSATGTFIVEGWQGNYPNYTAASQALARVGQTASFVNNEGEPSVNLVPQPLNGSGSLGPGGWNGNLILSVPEPSTIAIGALSGAALLLFRRRKA